MNGDQPEEDQAEEKQKEETTKKTEKERDNIVYVGKKSSMSYVLAVVTQFGEGENEVHLKARGRAISKVVDVAEIVKNRYVSESKITDIQTGTEQLEGDEGEKINVSTIDLTIEK